MFNSIFRKFPAAVFYCGVVLGLMGCVSGETEANKAPPTLTLSVEVYDASGNAVTSASPEATLTAKATIKDTTGVTQSGVAVTFASSSTDLSFSTTSAVTDAAGVASVNLSVVSKTSGGVANITASAIVKGATLDNASSPKLLTVTKPSSSSSTPTVLVEVYDASGNAVTSVAGAAILTTKAVVKDATGTAQGGVLVMFSSTSADLAFSTNSAVTDTTGVASVTLTTASKTTGGVASITAATTVKGTAVDNASSPKLLTVAKSSPSMTLSVKDSSGNPTSSATTTANVSVSATITDAAGNPQKNVPVTFSTDASYLVFIPSSGSASTGSTGTAVVAMTGASATTGGATQVAALAKLADGTLVSGTPVTVSVTGAPANVTPTPSLNLYLLDIAGVAATSLAVGSPLTVKAILRDGSGSPLANTVISLTSGDPTLATVSQASVLTDANGITLARLDAASIVAVGANYLNATATISGKPVAASAPFSVGAANVTMTLATSQPSISAYGTTTITATLKVNGQPPPAPMTVQFASGCASSGKASLPAGVQTVNGDATATYTDKGCGASATGTTATDTIVASVSSVQKNVTVTVAKPQAANVQFVGVTPASGLLVLKSTGGAGYSETATVKFRVVDTAGNGMANQNVAFDLTTRENGILLENLSSGTVTKQTDTNGDVSVTVQSGTAPTAVWVTASLGTLVTQSNKLVISTGRPAQKFLSFSAETFNIDGGSVDGVKTKLTVRASDRLGNLVPDGTTINFITEGGQIVSSDGSSSTCTIVSGACSVSLVSAAYRPNNGRVTVVAYTLGEKNFLDANGNNRYDPEELFDDLGDVYIDTNENGTWDSGEQTIRFSASNTQACRLSDGSVDASQKQNTCSGAWGQAHVRQRLVIVFSGNTAKTTSPTTLSWVDSCSKPFTVALTDEFNNPMAAGSTLSITDKTVTYRVFSGTTTTLNADGSISSSTDNYITYDADISVTPDKVQSGNAVGGGPTFSVTVSAPACVFPLPTGKDASLPKGTFNLTVATPAESSNTKTPIRFTVN